MNRRPVRARAGAIIAALSLFGSFPALAAPVQQVVAVLTFRNKLPPGQPLDMEYLTDSVRASVVEGDSSLKVITRENIVVLLQATGRTLAECEGECEVDTGRLVGADLVISGELTRFGNNYKLNMRLHDTHDGRLISGASASAVTFEELDKSANGAVLKLLSNVPHAYTATAAAPKPAPQQATATRQPAAQGPRSRWPLWTALGAAGVAGAAGGYFAMQSGSASNSLAAGGHTRAEADSLVSSVQGNAKMANVSLAIAATAAVAAGVVLLLQ